jgi:hypothetical protein
MKDLMRFALIVVMLTCSLITARSTPQTARDPHRPACNDARCKKIKAFVKAHYCGESPYGDGPDDGCAIVYPNSGTIVLRKLLFTKTDVDVPRVTTWKLLSLADADNDGQSDIILEGDAYEDHWFEVVVIDHASAQTIFSGLGYYL